MLEAWVESADSDAQDAEGAMLMSEVEGLEKEATQRDATALYPVVMRRVTELTPRLHEHNMIMYRLRSILVTILKQQLVECNPQDRKSNVEISTLIFDTVGKMDCTALAFHGPNDAMRVPIINTMQVPALAWYCVVDAVFRSCLSIVSTRCHQPSSCVPRAL